MLVTEPIIQIAYVVNNIEEAAAKHHNLFGSGPFFKFERAEHTGEYRGRQVTYTHSAAFGQWGDVQLELMERFGEGPSVIHDLYPAGSDRTGIHHMTIFADDFDEVTQRLSDNGCPAISRGGLKQWNMRVNFHDTYDLYGHYLEVYEEAEGMRDFYARVKEHSVGFDGSNLVRPFDTY